MGGDTTSGRKNEHGKLSKDNENALLDEIDKEIGELNKLIESQKTSADEIMKFSQPLFDAVSESKQRQWRKKAAQFSLSMLVIGICMAASWQIPWVQKITEVLFRKFMIMLLPYWNWTPLYYSDCLVTNPHFVRQTLTKEECTTCESVEYLDHLLSDVPPRLVLDDYLSNAIPFIVVGSMDDWPVMNTDLFWFENITEIYLSEEVRDILPCELETNIRGHSRDLRPFLRKVYNQESSKWFGHWENCDKTAAKALRPLYRRPNFFPHVVDLSDSNWIMMSSNYKGKVYKELAFGAELLWVAQIRGYTKIKLRPKVPCENICVDMVESLMEGQIVVIPGDFWHFEYLPGDYTDNIAIGVGGFWN